MLKIRLPKNIYLYIIDITNVISSELVRTIENLSSENLS